MRLGAAVVVAVLALSAGAGYGIGIFFRHIVFKRVPPQVARWLVLAAVAGLGFAAAVFIDRIDRSFPFAGIPILAVGFCWRGLMHRKADSPQPATLPVDYIVTGVLLLIVLALMLK